MPVQSKKIEFDKMVASGNDFIVIDNRDGKIRNAKALAQHVCPFHTSIGADGILLLEKSKKAAFKMRIVNSDGSEAEACGNGFRCIALYAHKRLKLPKNFKFESLSGIIEAHISGARVKVQLAKPHSYQDRRILEVQGNRLHYSFMNTGVPHAVILTEGLSEVDVLKLGRSVREHSVFKPAGTNVNFVEIQGLHDIHVRTYERGVENETLACGTGSTASALITSLAGYTKSPVRVRTSGGEILTIDFKSKGSEILEVTLEGEVRFVFEGVLNLSAYAEDAALKLRMNALDGPRRSLGGEGGSHSASARFRRNI